jgi:TonB-dependent starch-binding outer membrane protein SusC
MKLHLFICSICSLLYITKVEGQENQNRKDTSLFQTNANTDSYFTKNEAGNYSFVLDSLQFNRGMYISPLELIIGKVPGLSISSNNGKPGGSFTILNRGIGTFYTSSSPLIIVDDLITNNEQININPNDVERFTVLNDVSALAMYGEKASNGAIVITTKKGSKELKVHYAGKIGFSELPEQIDVYSADEYRTLINKRYADNLDVIDLLGNSSTNWQNEIYRTAFGQDHFLSVSGAVKTIPFRFSFGSTNQNGIIETSEYNRKTLSVNINPSLFDDHLKLNIRFNGVFNKNRIANENAIANAILFDPTQPVFNNSIYGGYFTWIYNNEPNLVAIRNPLALLKLTHNTIKTDRYLSNIKIDYKLHFFPDVRVVVNYGKDKYSSNDDVHIDTTASWTYWYGKGLVQKYNHTENSKQFDISLNYSKYIEVISSRINITVGYSQLKRDSSTYDYETNFGATYLLDSSYYRIENEQESRFFCLNYILKEKYSFNLSLQRDDNSRYAEKYKSAYSPAFSFVWNLKNESFLKENKYVSELNLSSGYGLCGAFQPSAGAVDWTHEKISFFKLDLNYGLFKNRIFGSVDYYLKTSDDLLMKVYVLNGSSFSNYIIVNRGKIENRGVEFMLNTVAVSTNNWFWGIGVNASYNKNKIISGDSYSANTGKILGAMDYIQIQTSGYPVNSFYVYQQVYDSNGKPLEGVYVMNTDNTVKMYEYKKAFPDVLMGITSTLNYKNFDFSFSGRLSLGNYVYNNVASSSYYNRIYLGYNYLANISKMVENTGFLQAQYYSDYYVENASYFRMDNVSLGYSFKNVFKTKLDFHLSMNVQNAFVITKYKGLDPEVASGVDGYAYPRPRIFSLGVSANF